MRIAIDLNDVMRDYSRNFVRYFVKGINKSFDYESFKLTSNDMRSVLPFANDEQYNTFTYSEYPYELYGACPSCHKDLPARFNDWHLKISSNFELEESLEFIIVSTKESALSIQSTYFFLAKTGNRVRETVFPEKTLDIWNKCDILITANPLLLNSKPENKLSVKINNEYNVDSLSDFNYVDMMEFISDNNNFFKIIEQWKIKKSL